MVKGLISVLPLVPAHQAPFLVAKVQGGFLFKLTGGLALTFFATSLLLSSMWLTNTKKPSNI
jgi:preprotein translocase subunit SecG